MIHIEYRLTAQEVTEFERMHFKIGPIRRPLRSLAARIPYINQLFLPFILIVVFCAIVLFSRSGDVRSSIGIYGLIFTFIVAQHFWSYFKNRKLLTNSPIIKFDFDINGFSRTEEFSRQEFGWSHIIHYAETDNLYLLYYDANVAFVLPKRSFANADELNELRLLVCQKVRKIKAESTENPNQIVPEQTVLKNSDTDGLLLSFEFKLEYRDIREFQRKYESIRPGVKWYSRQTHISPWVGYILAGVIVGLTIWAGIKSFMDKGFNSAIVPGILFGFGFLVFGILLPYWNYRQTKKAFDDKPSSLVRIYANRMVIDDRSVINELHYYFFKAFAETKNLFVLYFSDTNAIVIPRRAFKDPHQSDLFRNIVQAGITRTKGFPVQPVDVPSKLAALSVCAKK